MEKFLKDLAIRFHHLYNMMHGIPDAVKDISNFPARTAVW